MKTFIKFIKSLKGFWEFYKDYGYNGETVAFIIEQYEDILINRTKVLSKPTYYSTEVIKQIDIWYANSPEWYECIRKDFAEVE